MFNRTVFNEAQAKIDALDRSLAIIEFSMDGTVLHANQNFLRLMKYSLSDVQSRHHRIFVDKSYAETAEYAAFWDKLKDGQ